MTAKDDDIDASKAPLLDHLIELRQRLLYCVIGLVVAFFASFYFADQIFAFLVQPLIRAFGAGDEPKLIYTKLYEAFFVQLKVALFSAFFISFPLIANQLWGFIAPGLYRNEKSALLPFLLATPVLFTLGAAMAYYLVMPTAFRFFLSFEQMDTSSGGFAQEALPAMADYLSLVMHLVFAFGLAFLLPVLLMLLARAGIISLDTLVKGRRYAIVAAFALAAVITPPDVISQLMLAIPLILLYELSIIAIRFTQRRARKTAVAAPDEPQTAVLPADAAAPKAGD